MAKKLGNSPSRDEVLKYIAKSSRYGNLGLFIGAGFCKAVLNSKGEDIALSWGQLLARSALELGVDYSEIHKEGVGFPDIASSICTIFSTSKNILFKEASSELKKKIAGLTCWHPDNERRAEFGSYLDDLAPSWVITTNYDLVIESLLTGKSIPLGPGDQLTNPRGVVPVYHLHGRRLNPEEIIITQEDYVALFRPNEYRQIKLALTVKESTTLFLGYGLGDVNVLTAIDWSENVFPEGNRQYPQDVIQIVRTENPTNEPYRDRNGILILEVNDLVNFFTEFREVAKVGREQEEDIQTRLKDYAHQLAASDDKVVSEFIDDEKFRDQILRNLSLAPVHLISGFISLFEKSIEETWKRAEPRGAFGPYNENLIIILDILTRFDVAKIPPVLFQAAAYALDRVAYFVGENHGESWAAAATWEKRKGELSKEMLTELKNISNLYHYHNLKRLLKTV